MNSSHWLWLFRLAVAADLLAVYFQWDSVRLVSKPLIVLSLLIYFSLEVRSFNGIAAWFRAALFFSLAGDVSLLFESRHPLFFMAGLGCFLIAHVFYIVAFAGVRKLESRQGSHLRPKWSWIFGVLAYLIILLYVLLPYLGELMIPVIIYAFVLCAMLLTVVHAFRKPFVKPGIICLAGALFFVLSDSLLAINKFYSGFAFSGIAIMFTYACAQYFLVTGAVRMLRSTQTAKFDLHTAT
ncbi:MAG TPA: lysoplasmalogenase [Chitinophagaceae bacterium]